MFRSLVGNFWTPPVHSSLCSEPFRAKVLKTLQGGRSRGSLVSKCLTYLLLLDTFLFIRFSDALWPFFKALVVLYFPSALIVGLNAPLTVPTLACINRVLFHPFCIVLVVFLLCFFDGEKVFPPGWRDVPPRLCSSSVISVGVVRST